MRSTLCIILVGFLSRGKITAVIKVTMSSCMWKTSMPLWWLKTHRGLLFTPVLLMALKPLRRDGLPKIHRVLDLEMVSAYIPSSPTERTSFLSHGYEIPVDLCSNGTYIIQSIVNLLKKGIYWQWEYKHMSEHYSGAVNCTYSCPW